MMIQHLQNKYLKRHWKHIGDHKLQRQLRNCCALIYPTSLYHHHILHCSFLLANLDVLANPPTIFLLMQNHRQVKGGHSKLLYTRYQG